MKYPIQRIAVIVAIFTLTVSLPFGYINYQRGQKKPAVSEDRITNHFATFDSNGRLVDMDVYREAFNQGVTNGAGAMAVLFMVDGRWTITTDEANHMIEQACKAMARAKP